MMIFGESKETYSAGKFLLETKTEKLHLLGNKAVKPAQSQPKHIKDILSKMGLPIMNNQGV